MLVQVQQIPAVQFALIEQLIAQFLVDVPPASVARKNIEPDAFAL